MVEQAFIVDKDSKLYKEYFEAQAEKQKMHDLARMFFEKHDLLNDHLGYRMIENLALQLTPEQEEKYKTQLKVIEDADPRISIVGLDEPKLTTKFMFGDGEEFSLDDATGLDKFLDIVAKNVVEGKVSLFKRYQLTL